MLSRALRTTAVLALGFFAAVPVAAQTAQAPTVTGLTYTGTGPFYRGDAIFVWVDFSKRVRVSGVPLLALTVGTNTRYAEYLRTASPPNSILFRYRVARSDVDADGFSIPENAVSLNGGSITLEADGSVNAVLTHSAGTPGVGYTVDGSQSPAPTVGAIEVEAPRADSYKRHDSIVVVVTFAREIQVTGIPRMALTIGANTRYADYEEWPYVLRANSMRFRYVVRSSDSDSDGLAIPANAISLNGGTIALLGDATNAADLNHDAVADNPRFKVDGSTVRVLQAGRPYLSAGGPPGGTHGSCDAVRVWVGFASPVVVVGSPSVRLDIGGTTRLATFVSLTPSGHDMQFMYLVASADSDADGISIPANAISLNGGSIRSRDAPDLHATLTHEARPPYASHKVDGSKAAPNSLRNVQFASNTPAAGETYSLGEAIYLWVVFNQPVAVTGTPQLDLTVGAATRKADFQYVHRLFPNFALFSYIVAASDIDTDGVAVPASTLSLNGGTIARRCDSLAPTLTHGAVAGASGRKVDGSVTVAPRVTAVRFTNTPVSDFAYDAGETITASVSFDRAVTVSGAVQLGLTIGGNVRQAGFQRIERQGLRADFAYTVQESDSDTNGISIAANAISPSGGAITLKGDSAATAASLIHVAVRPDLFRKVTVRRPKVSLALGSSTIDESGSNSSTTVKATLSRAVSSPVTVTLSASPAGKVRFGSATLTIPANATESDDVTVTAINNQEDRPDARVRIFVWVSGTAVDAPDSVTLTVTDDDLTPGVWSATLKVDQVTNSGLWFFGCDNNDRNQDDCSDSRVLTEDQFVYEGPPTP